MKEYKREEQEIHRADKAGKTEKDPRGNDGFQSCETGFFKSEEIKKDRGQEEKQEQDFGEEQIAI